MNHEDARAQYAVAAAKRGEFDNARAVVIDLVSEDWNNAVAHRAWGRVLLEEGKTSDAVAAYRTAANLDPREADVHFELANALLEEAEKSPFLPLENWLEARNAAQEGLTRAPVDEFGIDLLRQIEDHRDRVLN